MQLIRIFVFAAMLLTVMNGFSQDKAEYKASAIPDSLKNNVNAVIRNHETVVEILKPGKATITETLVITILNSKGSYLSECGDFYDEFSEITRMQGSVYDSEGKLIRKSKESEVSDRSIRSESGFVVDDARVKWISLNQSQYPYTVAFDEVTEIYGYLSIQPWKAFETYNTSLERASFSVRHPADVKIKYLLQNCEDAEHIHASGNETWKFGPHQGLKAEPFAPAKKYLLPTIYATSMEFQVKGVNGSLSSWQSFGDFVYKLNEGREKLRKNDVPPELFVSLNGDKKKTAEKLYTYLQDNTRYVSIQLGIGGWQSFEASYVNKYKIGDCKALTTYMKGLLSLAGIPSYSVLVSAGEEDEKVSPDFPYSNFNHVILMIPFENDTTWLECTSQNNPFGYLSNFTEGRTGLLLDGTSSRLIKLPPVGAEVVKVRSDVTLREDLYASVKTTLSATGEPGDDLRDLQNVNDDKLKEWLLDYFRRDIKKIESIQTSTSADKLELKVACSLQVQNVLSKAGKNYLMEANILTRAQSLTQAVASRTLPVQNDHVRMVSDSTIYHLPEGFKPKSTFGDSAEIHSAFGKYKSRMKYDEKINCIVFTKEFKLDRFMMPAEKYAELRSFLASVYEAERKVIVLSPQ